jgi:aarF domain-containing kinase
MLSAVQPPTPTSPPLHTRPTTPPPSLPPTPAGMGASLLLGSLSDSFTRAISPPKPSSQSKSGVYDAFITEANAERLANALCRMRGAALKLGQMLSIQDENVLPPQVGDVAVRSRLWHLLLAALVATGCTGVCHYS